MKIDRIVLMAKQNRLFSYMSCWLIKQISSLAFVITIIALIFCIATRISAQSSHGPNKSSPSSDTLIINTDLVNFNVTVTDMEGHHVMGLKRDSFTVYDNGVKQDIELFDSEDAPASICIILDLSGSMSEDKLERAKKALGRFMENGHELDEYFLIGFNQRVRLLQDSTNDPNEILNSFILAEAKGQTALFDACYIGIEKLTRASQSKKIILLVSDGQDNSSRYTFNEVKELLKESDVSIYSIAIQNSVDKGTMDGMRGLISLKNLSGISGGLASYQRIQMNLMTYLIILLLK